MSRIRESSSLPQGKKMHAVVEARSYIKAVPRWPDEPKLDWIERAGSVFGLTFSQAKKIIYDEVKDISATRLDRMREIKAKLAALKEQADDNQRRINELIYWRADVARTGGVRPTAGRSDRGDASRPGEDRSSRGDVPEARPTDAASAAVPRRVEKGQPRLTKRYFAG